MITSAVDKMKTMAMEYYETHDKVSIAKDFVLLYIVLKIVLGQVFKIKSNLNKLYVSICNIVIFKIYHAKTQGELLKIEKSMCAQMIKTSPKVKQYNELPKNGLSDKEVYDYMDTQLLEIDSNFKNTLNGKVSGAVYHGGSELIHLQSEIYEKYCITNQLHPDCFPSLRNMESEVVSMLLKLFTRQAPNCQIRDQKKPAKGLLHTGEYSFCGTTSSGGTESILLACLSARNYYYSKYGKDAAKPQLIIAETAHAAFYKACEYFQIELVTVPVDAQTGYKLLASTVKPLMSYKTCILVGSAPNFPHGIIDDIQGLSQLALKWDIPLHVDCCLGSLLMPFFKDTITSPNELFDFNVPGVTSISCDTHKYGYTPKGSSVIMYKYETLRLKQYYIQTNWTGGLYGSPTLQGSRSGALIANCFATLLKFGDSGYSQAFNRINAALLKVVEFMHTDELISQHLSIIGDPKVSVVAFKFTKPHLEKKIYDLNDILKDKYGYHLSSLQKPCAVHYCLTYLASTDENIKSFCIALKESLQILLKQWDEGASSLVQETKESETAQMYGVAGSISTAGVAEKIVELFLNICYKSVDEST